MQSYFQILEDTWLGFFLPSFHRSIRKSQTRHPKFYFFDCGVKRALEKNLHGKLSPSTAAYGEAFEHWVILEIFKLNEYFFQDYRLSYLRTKDDAEIDLILSRGKEEILIEIKSSEIVDIIQVAKFERLHKIFPQSTAYFLSRDPVPQLLGKIQCLPWHEGIRRIFFKD